MNLSIRRRWALVYAQPTRYSIAAKRYTRWATEREKRRCDRILGWPYPSSGMVKMHAAHVIMPNTQLLNDCQGTMPRQYWGHERDEWEAEMTRWAMSTPTEGDAH